MERFLVVFIAAPGDDQRTKCVLGNTPGPSKFYIGNYVRIGWLKRLDGLCRSLKGCLLWFRGRGLCGRRFLRLRHCLKRILSRLRLSRRILSRLRLSRSWLSLLLGPEKCWKKAEDAHKEGDQA